MADNTVTHLSKNGKESWFCHACYLTNQGKEYHCSKYNICSKNLLDRPVSNIFTIYVPTEE